MPKITTGGRVTIPKRIRTGLRLRAGDSVEFVAVEKGEFVNGPCEEAAAKPNKNLRSATT